MASATPTMQLLSKITVGGQELKNRVVLAAMTRARCNPTENPLDVGNTIPNDIMGDYYEQRASAGLLLTEATAISEEGSGWLNAPHLRNDEQVNGWKKIVDRVHAKDCKIYVQLWHIGRQTHSSFHPTTNRIVSASNEQLSGDKANIYGEKLPTEIPHSLTIDEIKSTVQDYVNAAILAKEAGFDGIAIHSGNGYLIDQFLQSCTNKRTDIYGGSIENRCRIMFEIIDAIIASGSYPAERIGFKISPNGTYGDMGSEDNYDLFLYLAEKLNKYNLSFMEVMDGLGFGYHNKCKAVTCMDLKKVFDSPIIANVGITKDIGEGMIRSGTVDMISFGRLYISNPDLVERITNDWPIEEGGAYEHWWYATAEKGYTDFPVYK